MSSSISYLLCQSFRIIKLSLSLFLGPFMRYDNRRDSTKHWWGQHAQGGEIGGSAIMILILIILVDFFFLPLWHEGTTFPMVGRCWLVFLRLEM